MLAPQVTRYPVLLGVDVFRDVDVFRGLRGLVVTRSARVVVVP